MMVECTVTLMHVFATLLVPLAFGSPSTSHTEILGIPSCNTSWTVGPQYLIYVHSADDVLTVSLRRLADSYVQSANFTIVMDYTRYLAYLQEHIIGVFVKNHTYHLFALRIRASDVGSLSFIRSEELHLETLPPEYGPTIRSLVPDNIGLRVFMSGVRSKPTRISNIFYYDPGSHIFQLVYTLQQPIFDMAYYPIKRRLYVLAAHMLILDLDYLSGNLFVSPNRRPIKTSCNYIFGILQLASEQMCMHSYPLIHFVRKPKPRKRWYVWKAINGETGVCYQSQRNASVPRAIRKYVFFPRRFAILYTRGSIFAAPRAKYDLHGPARSALEFVADGMTAMCGAAPRIFSWISHKCFMAANYSDQSIIDTDVAIINRTSMRVATFYNSDSFSANCQNISFPSLTVRAEFPPAQFCTGDACTDEVPYIVDTVTAPGVITFTRLLPGLTYNVTILARGYYISKVGLYTVNKKVQLHIPYNFGKVQIASSSLGIGFGVMVPLIVLTLLGSTIFIYKKRSRRSRKGPSVSNELYAGLDGICYYNDIQIKILNNGIPVGEGQFGQVFEGLIEKQPDDADHGTKVAVKQVEDVTLMLREAKVMFPLNHENIVRLVGICQDLLQLPCLILEWMDRGSLLSLLKAGPLEATQQKDAVVQVCCGLKYISDFGCVHRDIAARNVLINSFGFYKLSDFGLSREIPADKDYYRMVSGGILPVKWMAPESLQRSPIGLFSTKSDIWSFGVLIYEVLTSGSDPYPGLSAEEAIKLIRQGGAPALPSMYSNETQLLVNQCWMQEPEKRPTPSALLGLLEGWDPNAFQPAGSAGYTVPTFEMRSISKPEQDPSLTPFHHNHNSEALIESVA